MHIVLIHSLYIHTLTYTQTHRNTHEAYRWIFAWTWTTCFLVHENTMVLACQRFHNEVWHTSLLSFGKFMELQSMFVTAFVCVRVDVWVRVCTYTSIHIQLHTYTYMHACTHTRRTCTCIRLYFFSMQSCSLVMNTSPLRTRRNTRLLYRIHLVCMILRRVENIWGWGLD